MPLSTPGTGPQRQSVRSLPAAPISAYRAIPNLNGKGGVVLYQPVTDWGDELDATRDSLTDHEHRPVRDVVWPNDPLQNWEDFCDCHSAAPRSRHWPPSYGRRIHATR